MEKGLIPPLFALGIVFFIIGLVLTPIPTEIPEQPPTVYGEPPPKEIEEVKETQIEQKTFFIEEEHGIRVKSGKKDKTKETIDTIPPTISILGAPSDWQSNNAIASLSCIDDAGGSGCDSFTYRLYLSNTTLDSCPIDFFGYSLTSPQTISSNVWVCGAAKDNAGNIGFSTPLEFKIDKLSPSSSIIKPKNGATVTSILPTVEGAASDNVKVSNVEVYILDTTFPITPETEKYYDVSREKWVEQIKWNKVLGTTSWSLHTLGVFKRDHQYYACSRAIDKFNNTQSQLSCVTFSYLGPPLPVITSIYPNSGSQDSSIGVEITGDNFDNVKSVNFKSDITATIIQSRRTQTLLPLTLNIDKNAQTGPRAFTLIISDGTIVASYPITFTITPKPVDTILPTSSITNPENNAELSSLLAITGIASDNIAVKHVDILILDTTFPFTPETEKYYDDSTGQWVVEEKWNRVLRTEQWNYPIGGVLQNNHKYYTCSRATDIFGNTQKILSCISFTYIPKPIDRILPNVLITQPSNDATISGIIIIEVTANDNKGISKVELYIDETLLGTDTLAPYSFSWDTKTVTNGTHLITAIAHDTSNNRNIHFINVNVDNDKTPPTIVIVQPLNNAIISGVINIEAEANDNNGIAKVEFYLDETLLTVDSIFPYKFSWDTRATFNGLRTIIAIAYDTSNNRNIHFILVNVNN